MVTAPVHAQMPDSRLLTPDSEAGHVLQHTVEPADYESSPQNWAATRDSLNQLYVANSGGLLAYNGTAWTRMEAPGSALVRSVDGGVDGPLYIGMNDDIGQVVRQPDGSLEVISLLEHVPDAFRPLGDVDGTIAVDGGVYFRSFDHLLYWEEATQTMYGWAPDTPIAREALVRDTLFTHASGEGIVAVTTHAHSSERRSEAIAAHDDTLALPPLDTLQIATSSALRDAHYAAFLDGYDDDGLVMASYNGEIFVRSNGTFEEITSPIQERLNDAWTYNGIALPNGQLALGTIHDGVFILNADGSLATHYSTDAPVLNLHLDQHGGLWGLLDGSIVRWHLDMPVTTQPLVDVNENTSGRINTFARHQGELHIGTMTSLLRLVPNDAPASPPMLEPVTQSQTWDLLSVGETLLVAEINGLDVHRAEADPRRLWEATTYALHPATHDTTRIYATTSAGLGIAQFDDNQWTALDLVEDVGVASQHLVEAPDGSLWVQHPEEGIQQVWTNAQGVDSLRTFTTEHELPEGRPSLVRANDRVLAYYDSTAYTLRSPENDTETPFARDTTVVRTTSTALTQLTALPPSIATSDAPIWWGKTTEGPALFRATDTGYAEQALPYRRFQHFASHSGMHLETTTAGDTLLWFGADDTLYRHHFSATDTTTSHTPHLHTTHLTAGDRVVSPSAWSSESPLDVAYANNTITAQVAAPSYRTPGETRFRYRTNDDTWSDWTQNSTYTMPNLREGAYTLHVQAETGEGVRSAVHTIPFRIQPPWYRTLWAYLMYGLLATGGIIALVQWRSRHLRARQQTLEATVAARTAEVEAQKEQLRQQAHDLKQLDEAKSRFFANLSHEFRTPLTLILGPVRRLKETLNRRASLPPKAATDQLDLVERNAYRLLRMVQQILDLARHDAGVLQLRAHPTDLGTEAERITQSFAPLAEQQQLTLTCTDHRDTAEPVYLDPDGLEQILGNLLSNAIKFTPKGGHVDVHINATPTTVQLAVADTGIGIPEAQQTQIFERFTQVDDASTRTQEGTGIGLALTHTLVSLHGGTLTVDSTEGEGTTFSVTFQRGHAHLPEEHIVQSPDASASPSPASDASPTEPDPATPPANTMPQGTEEGPATTPSDAASPPSDEDRPLVLIVDDNDDVRTYVRTVLHPTFRIAEAATGVAGLEQARTLLPDVILADIMMPKMDGLAMTNQLRTEPETAAIPIVMLTARAGIDDELEGLQAGALDYIRKPFDARVLETRIRGTLAYQHRLRRKLEEAAAQSSDTDSAPDPTTEDESRSDIENKLRRVIQDHITNPNLDAQWLANAANVSRSTLYRRLNNADAPSPAALIRTVRLEEGYTLLNNNEGTVSEVAYAVGFQSLSHFSRQFSDHFGHAPTSVMRD